MKLKKISVLIVDDNSFYLKRMRAMLTELENVSTVSIAENYKDAFSILDTEEHDMVLMDIQLPDGNGMNLLKSIKESDRNCEVIMISNCTDEYYRIECKKLGAQHFLDKTREFDMVPQLLCG